MKLTGKKLRRLPRLPVLSLLVAVVYTSSAVAQAPGLFIPTGNMTTPRSYHTATLLLNGKVLITGGSDGHSPYSLASAELYDPETGTFSATGDMRTPRAFHSATLLPNGRVLIAGGFVPDGYTATAEVYDPSTGTFIGTGNMVKPMPFGTATLLKNGKVLISVLCSDWFSAEPELYDPLTGTFSSAEGHTDTKPHYSCGPAIELANGKVLIASELFDPATDTFSFTSYRNGIGSYDTTATLLTNGKVLVAGGSGDFGFSANADLYDPSTGRFFAAGNMIRARAGHTATLLRDGMVLITGGYVSASSAELYDPVNAIFVSTGDMLIPRARHTATLLMDGRVLMAGGTTPDFPSAQLYVPSALPARVVVSDLRFDRTSVVAGSAYSVTVSGSNLTPQTFFDVRFLSPGKTASDAVLNWQEGIAASHGVPLDAAPGIWTISGVRPHQIETDHTGDFVPVSATITVSP